MRHPVKHGLGHSLFIEQVGVVPGDQVALLQHRVLQAPQTVHDGDLGGQHLRVVGLDQHIIAPGFHRTGQGVGVFERGEENDRHQRLASQRLDLPRGFKAVHDWHQRVHQHQLRALLGKQRHRFGAIGSQQHAMPLLADNARKQQAIDRTVFSDQQGERLDVCV